MSSFAECQVQRVTAVFDDLKQGLSLFFHIFCFFPSFFRRRVLKYSFNIPFVLITCPIWLPLHFSIVFTISSTLVEILPPFSRLKVSTFYLCFPPIIIYGPHIHVKIRCTKQFNLFLIIQILLTIFHS